MAQALARRPCRAKAVSLSKVMDARSRGSSRRNTAETVGISVYGRAVDHQPAMALVKRSPKRTANWALASGHSRGGILHAFSARFKTRKRSLSAASSVGKWPLVLTARRSFEFKASMALVV